MHSQLASEAVSPSKLFALACARFTSALGILDSDAPGYAPNATYASVAMREAHVGISALQSVLVPATPFEQRQMAATAIDQANRAIDQLNMYRGRMAQRGEGPFHRTEIGTGTLLLLDRAGVMIRAAINRVS